MKLSKEFIYMDTAEAEAFAERVAICIFDGGLTEREAHEVAFKELQSTKEGA